MKIKKISSMILTLSLCLAPLNSLAISNDSIPVEPEMKVEDVNSEETINSEENQPEKSSIGGIIVALSLKASHANAHHSYTKIVTRQGKKYEVTYEAIPRSECYLCEYNSY